MKFHIVGNGETVEDILQGYDLTIEELKNENKHIRIWNKLIPGTKLKIPILSEAIIDDINTIEPFLEEYYPKIKIEEDNQIIKDFDDESNEIEITELLNEDDINNDEHLNHEDNKSIQETVEQNMEKVITENSETIKSKGNINNNQIYYRYIYPQPYYYRPIIYVIPRK